MDELPGSVETQAQRPKANRWKTLCPTPGGPPGPRRRGARRRSCPVPSSSSRGAVSTTPGPRRRPPTYLPRNGPGNPDHLGCRPRHSLPDREDLRVPTAQPVENRPCRLDLPHRGGPLHRDHGAVAGHQRHRPFEEPWQRCDGPRRDHIEGALTVQGVGTTPHHRHRVQLELLHHLTKERRAALQRLDQGDPSIRPSHRQHEPRKASAATDIRDPRARRDHLGQDRAVHQVPLPQPGHLPGPDQPSFDARGRQQLGVPLRDREPVARKQLVRRRRWQHPPSGLRPGCFT